MVLQLVSLWLTVTARNICLGQNEMLETHRTLKTFFFPVMIDQKRFIIKVRVLPDTNIAKGCLENQRK